MLIVPSFSSNEIVLIAHPVALETSDIFFLSAARAILNCADDTDEMAGRDGLLDKGVATFKPAASD